MLRKRLGRRMTTSQNSARPAVQDSGAAPLALATAQCPASRWLSCFADLAPLPVAVAVAVGLVRKFEVTGGGVVPAPLGRHGTSAVEALDIVALRRTAERDKGSTQRTDAYDDQQDVDHDGFPSLTPPACSRCVQGHTDRVTAGANPGVAAAQKASRGS